MTLRSGGEGTQVPWQRRANRLGFGLGGQVAPTGRPGPARLGLGWCDRWWEGSLESGREREWR
jgi:hypothetical protein